MKKIVGSFVSILLGSVYVMGAPVTHPTTNATVTRPQTTVTVSRPKTAPAVVTHLPTFSTVERPTTNVVVTHPATPGSPAALAQEANAAANTTAAAPAGTKKAAPEKTDQKPSMMSTYQPKQAKDLKAPKLGATDGLGKDNRAEKDAAAAELKMPKAEAASVESVLNGGNSNLKSKISGALSKEVK